MENKRHLICARTAINNAGDISLLVVFPSGKQARNAYAVRRMTTAGSLSKWDFWTRLYCITQSRKHPPTRSSRYENVGGWKHNGQKIRDNRRNRERESECITRDSIVDSSCAKNSMPFSRDNPWHITLTLSIPLWNSFSRLYVAFSAILRMAGWRTGKEWVKA